MADPKYSATVRKAVHMPSDSSDEALIWALWRLLEYQQPFVERVHGWSQDGHRGAVGKEVTKAYRFLTTTRAMQRISIELFQRKAMPRRWMKEIAPDISSPKARDVFDILRARDEMGGRAVAVLEGQRREHRGRKSNTSLK
jgi:hypothetical protein